MHAARILLHASLAVLEAFKLEGRLVVLATFGGPMQSKFRLFVGSALLLALPAFGQASEPTPAATTAAGAIAQLQHGDGVYLVLISNMDPKQEKWNPVGFVSIKNLRESNGIDVGEWVLSESAMLNAGSRDGKLPLPADKSVRLDFLNTIEGDRSFLTICRKYMTSIEGSRLGQDDFDKFHVVSVRNSVLSISGKYEDVINAQSSDVVGAGAPR